MPSQYLAEGLKGSFPFVADTKNIVVESLPGGGTRTRIPGRFSVCDCINGNGRRYSKGVWEKNLQPGSLLTKSIQENAAWGLLEHPKDGQVTLQSPICIRTTAAKLQEGKTPEGKPVWEVVVKPSFESALLSPTPEAKTTAESVKPPTAPISETVPPVTTSNSPALTFTAVVTPEQPPAATAAASGVKVTLEAAEKVSQAPTAGASAPVK